MQSVEQTMDWAATAALSLLRMLAYTVTGKQTSW